MCTSTSITLACWSVSSVSGAIVRCLSDLSTGAASSVSSIPSDLTSPARVSVESTAGRDARRTTVLDAIATLTLRSDCATSRKMWTSLALALSARSSLSAQTARSAFESGSNIPSATKSRQRSFLGVAPCVYVSMGEASGVRHTCTCCSSKTRLIPSTAIHTRSLLSA